MATPSPVYFFKHVKHVTRNIQNDCHQWLSGIFRVHQIRFWPGLWPAPTGRAYSAPHAVRMRQHVENGNHIAQAAMTPSLTYRHTPRSMYGGDNGQTYTYKYIHFSPSLSSIVMISGTQLCLSNLEQPDTLSAQFHSRR